MSNIVFFSSDLKHIDLLNYFIKLNLSKKIIYIANKDNYMAINNIFYNKTIEYYNYINNNLINEEDCLIIFDNYFTKINIDN